MGTADVLATIETGTSLIVGTVSADGEPRAARAWGAVVHDPQVTRLRILMCADDETAVANLSTGVVALTGAHVRTYRSTQLKGRVLAVEAPTPDDLDLVRVHAETFMDVVEEVDGMPKEQTRRMLPLEVVAVEMEVETRFDQSPGPAAGAMVKP